MTKIVAIPKRIQRIVDECAGGGQRLTISLRPFRENVAPDPIFRLEPSGREVSCLSAREAIERGLLVPAGDGLFGAETSQTFIARS